MTGTPDLLGYVAPPKPEKKKRNRKELSPTIATMHPIYGPRQWPTVVLISTALLFYFSRAYDFQLTNFDKIGLADLPTDVYEAITFCGMALGGVWFVVSFVDSIACHFRSNPERRALKWYSSRTKARVLATSIVLGSVSLIGVNSILVWHAFSNAREVVIAGFEKFRQGRKAEIEIALRIDPLAGVEAYGPPAPVVKTEPRITGSINKRPSKAKLTTTKVDPLAETFQMVAEWWQRHVGGKYDLPVKK